MVAVGRVGRHQLDQAVVVGLPQRGDQIAPQLREPGMQRAEPLAPASGEVGQVRLAPLRELSLVRAGLALNFSLEVE